MKNIKSNRVIDTITTTNTSQNANNFWDHTDGEYNRKIIPGGIIWQFVPTGIITIKTEIGDKVKKGRFDSISITLYTNNGLPQRIPDEFTATELNPKDRYRLIVLALIKNKSDSEEKTHDESWVIDFLPQDS